MTAEETITSLEAKLAQALEQLAEVREQLRVAQAHIAELEQQKTPPPAFVKANKKKAAADPKKARKKREAQSNHGRPRSEQPTHIVEHRVLNCPHCQLRLGGVSVARVREVIDIPAPQPVEVTHHRIYKGWCAACQQWYEAPVEWPSRWSGKAVLACAWRV